MMCSRAVDRREEAEEKAAKYRLRRGGEWGGKYKIVGGEENCNKYFQPPSRHFFRLGGPPFTRA